MREAAESVVELYKTAHSSLSLITNLAIANKINTWAKKMVYFQQSSSVVGIKRKEFDVKLDELFEVLKCRCRMWRTEEGQVRIECHCAIEDKIPVMEIEFIFVQRFRGSKPPVLKMGGIDMAVSQQLKKSAARKVNYLLHKYFYNIFSFLSNSLVIKITYSNEIVDYKQL